jgi:hypothetical protein
MRRLTMKKQFPNGTTLYWTPGSNGGGITQYTDFTDILSNDTKVYNRGLEWCAGLGAIGFSIMDIKKVQYVCLYGSIRHRIEGHYNYCRGK